MKNYLSAILKYLYHYPNAKLWFIYIVRFETDNGTSSVTFIKDKKYLRTFSKQKDLKVTRKLMCRTLF